MAVFYNEGENKIRPGVYQRHSNSGLGALVGARDGIVAIPIQAKWGPLGKVVKNTGKKALYATYGTGTLGAGYTVPVAEEIFNAGAPTVYTYRLGTGGKAASKEIVTGLTVTAKHVGTASISVAVQAKIGDATMKEFLVYFGNEQVEKFTFAVDTKAEGANLVEAAKESKYVTVAATPSGTLPTVVQALAVADGELEGGQDPTVTNENYSTAFQAFESYYFNTITIDVDDDENLTLSLLLQSYIDNAYLTGKLCVGVVGEKTTVDFEKRKVHATAFNDAKMVYLGGGFKAGNVDKDGVLSIARTAGVIAATPSSQGITHLPISSATELCETLTNVQYEEAIQAGMLLLSMSPDGTVWYDSGINTLVTPDAETQDDGWKKIRRTKTRFEIIDRLDRVLLPKVGRISNDSDGVADVIQSAQRVLDAMAGTERKLLPGATIVADPDNPFTADSVWFIIQADDIDSMEKIYLQYQFRYSQNV